MDKKDIEESIKELEEESIKELEEELKDKKQKIEILQKEKIDLGHKIVDLENEILNLVFTIRTTRKYD